MPQGKGSLEVIGQWFDVAHHQVVGRGSRRKVHRTAAKPTEASSGELVKLQRISLSQRPRGKNLAI